MALKDVWIDKINDEDYVDAEDINQIANAVIAVENKLEENNSDPGGVEQESEVFTAEYGVTPGDEVFEAVLSGKTVICKYTEQIEGEDVVLQIPSYSFALDTDEIRFTATTENRVIHIYVYSTSNPAAWRVETHDLESYIPVRGVDYWTEEDIAEIKSYVDDAILGGAW